MIYITVAVFIVVLGCLIGLWMWIRHVEANYHNTELDQLLERMKTWDEERTKLVTTAEAINADISTLKTAFGIRKLG